MYVQGTAETLQWWTSCVHQKHTKYRYQSGERSARLALWRDCWHREQEPPQSPSSKTSATSLMAKGGLRALDIIGSTGGPFRAGG